MKTLFVLLPILFVLTIPAITKAESPMMCTMQYDPVCGTKQGVYKTYGNSCVLGVEGATYQHDGECTAAELNGRQEGTYTPPAHCTAWFDGCNSCSRSAGGQSMCTLMACMGEPRAGYCRTYEERGTATPPQNPPGVTGSGNTKAVGSEVATEATTTAETGTESTTVENDPGFFFGLWRAIAAWFRGLF